MEKKPIIRGCDCQGEPRITLRLSLNGGCRSGTVFTSTRSELYFPSERALTRTSVAKRMRSY